MTKAKFEALEFSEIPPGDMVITSRNFYLDMKGCRTVREFSDRPVPQEVIRNAISAAGTSPSGANQQPWHFAVVSKPETKRSIREAAEREERAFYQGRAPGEWLEALELLGTDEQNP